MFLQKNKGRKTWNLFLLKPGLNPPSPIGLLTAVLGFFLEPDVIFGQEGGAQEDHLMEVTSP